VAVVRLVVANPTSIISMAHGDAVACDSSTGLCPPVALNVNFEVHEPVPLRAYLVSVRLALPKLI
jgi:hypothetical protein